MLQNIIAHIIGIVLGAVASAAYFSHYYDNQSQVAKEDVKRKPDNQSANGEPHRPNQGKKR